MKNINSKNVLIKINNSDTDENEFDSNNVISEYQKHRKCLVKNNKK